MTSNNSIPTPTPSPYDTTLQRRSQTNIPSAPQPTKPLDQASPQIHSRILSSSDLTAAVNPDALPSGASELSPHPLHASLAHDTKTHASLAHDTKTHASSAHTHDASFIQALNNRLFSNVVPDPSPAQTSNDFPLKIVLSANSHQIIAKLNELHLANHVKHGVISCQSRPSADAIVQYLYDSNWASSVTLDYSSFISHPGSLFVKNLHRSLTSEASISSFFNSKCPFASLSSINIFDSTESNHHDEVLAILKFDVYLDVDHLIQHLDLSINPFQPPHLGKPLYINRYISKRERKLKDESPHRSSTPSPSNKDPKNDSSGNVYDTIILENLSQFLPSKISLSQFGVLLSQFEKFAMIESIYFPINHIDDSGDLKLGSFGYIAFHRDSVVNDGVLRSLYYLNNLTYDAFQAFKLDHDISQDINIEDEIEMEKQNNRIKISIAQHKHNVNLFRMLDQSNSGQPQMFLYNQPVPLHSRSSTIPLSVGVMNMALQSAIINKFSRHQNYQETNVYVNNFPVLFDNNDQLWTQFWDQFGKIKSAKIIKPSFYNNRRKSSHDQQQHDSELISGRIGFVFYVSFKMALRAILLTNNRIVTHPSSKTDTAPVTIQTSFAIQKAHSYHHYHPNQQQHQHGVHDRATRHSASAGTGSWNYFNQPQRTSIPLNYYPMHNSSNNYLKRFSLPIFSEAHNYYGNNPTPSSATAPASAGSDPLSNPFLTGFVPSGSSPSSVAAPRGTPGNVDYNYYNPYMFYNYFLANSDTSSGPGSEAGGEGVPYNPTTSPPPVGPIRGPPPPMGLPPNLGRGNPFFYPPYYQFQPVAPPPASAGRYDSHSQWRSQEGAEPPSRDSSEGTSRENKD